MHHMLISSIHTLMKTLEATTDSARRRARRLIEKVLLCRPAAFNQHEHALLEQLKNALTAQAPIDRKPVSMPEYSGWSPLGI
jgi:hypothetical protein